MLRFVSLGADCQTAAQLSVFAGTQPPQFFDKIAVPIRSVIQLIENNFADLMLSENLHPIYSGETLACVVDTLHRIDFGHDFNAFDTDEIMAVRKRYQLCVRWFAELLQPDARPVYFVRRWHPRDGSDDELNALRLYEVLRAKRADVRLLYLHKDQTRQDVVVGGYRSTFLHFPENCHWKGNTPAWQDILRNFACRPLGAEDHAAFPLRGQFPVFVRN